MSSGRLQGLRAELAQGVVAALQELAGDRQAGAVGAEPGRRLDVVAVVGRAGSPRALGGLNSAQRSADGPWRESRPGVRRESDWCTVMSIPA